MEKVLRGAKKRTFPLFCSQKCKNAFFAFWTGKHLPEPYVYKDFYALAKTVIFLRFQDFLHFTGNNFHFCRESFTSSGSFLRRKVASQKRSFGLCFKGCTKLSRAKNGFGALFAKSSQHFGNLRFGAKKCDFFKKNQLFRCQEFHVRPDRSKPYETCPFFRCFGVHFPPFRTFSLNFTFFAPKPFLARKITFLRKSAHFCGLG